MNGHLAEAQKRFAILEDFDEDTFVRFIEWAHKGYYTAADFTTLVEEGSDTAGSRTAEDHVAGKTFHWASIPILEADNQGFPSDPTPVAPEPVAELIEEPGDSWGGWESKISKKGKSKKRLPSPESPIRRTPKEDLRESFTSRRPLERKSTIKLPPKRKNKSSAEIYSDVFLSHARLYVFAEKYDIQPLKSLALDELHATLAIFTLYPKRTGDITHLLRYVYANTSEPREGIEDLRTLMTQYMGCEMDTLIGDEDFKDLILEDGGPLLGDFLTVVRRRLRTEDRFWATA